MKTEYKLAEALKNMMTEMPIDEISVTAIAKKCHVNRQTFYYHFHDIYDLLTLVFLNEQIPNINNAKNLAEMVGCIYKYYVKNSSFIDATLDSAGKDLFKELIYNSCYQTINRFVDGIYESKKLKENDVKSIVRFYALAYSNAIVYYLSNFKTKSLDGLMMSFCFIGDDNLVNSVHKMMYVRSKKR